MDNSKGLIKRFIALMLCALIFIAYTPGMAYALEEQPEETPAAEENLDTVPESETEDPGEAVQESGEEEAAPEQSLDEPEAEPEIVAEPEAEPEKEAEPTAESDSAVTDSAIIVAPAEAKAESFVPDVEVEDDLLQKYVDEKVTEELRGASGKSFSKIGKVNLEGADYKLYKQLVPLFTAVADGESDSAVFSIPLSNLFSEEELAFRLTEDDFEEPLLVEGDSGWEISEDAAESLYSYFVPDFKAVLNAMLADMPYEMYWFDKTRGIGVDYPSIRYREENGVGYLALMDNAEYGISFIVSGDYSADATFDSRGSLGTTTTNTTLTRAASSAAKNNAGVITDNNSKSDYDRLVAYKDAIIGMTDYNDDAYENNPPYGDPWQLIFVFDNDPDTKVVCEGYSKAFQYLCDNTVFNSPKIDCYTVSGEMTGATGAGAHMWNILHMNDSKNYIADITNSDTGTVGYESDKNKDPDGSWLFLNGYDSGDMNYGYVYNSDGKTIKYVVRDNSLINDTMPENR